MSGKSKGLLYIATGDRHNKEALASAILSRPFACDLPIYCITDQVDQVSSSGVFDKVSSHIDPVRSYRDKITAMLSLPFKRTLFLDTDAFLLRPLIHCFRLLRLPI